MKFTRESRADFRRRLRKAVPSVERHLKAANEKTADDMTGMMRRLVEVEKGTLRASIRTEPGQRNPTAVIIRAGGPTTTKPVREGADASYDYALAMEWGNSRQPAEPFFYVSVRAGKRGHKNRVNKAFRTALKEAGFGG